MDVSAVFWRVSMLVGALATSLSSQNEVRWTPWYNTDQPTGVGDIEKLSDIRRIYARDVCKEPVHIEVRTIEGTHVRGVDQTVHYSPEEGFWCLNNEQTSRICLDYKVRFLCKVKTRKTHSKESYRNATVNRVEDDIWRRQAESRSTWSSWSRCDVTCGGVGIQRRAKRCDKDRKRPSQCEEGEVEETRPCGDVPCQKTSSRCETSGIVTDTTNIPLSGVGIGLGTTGGRGLTTLTMTDDDGRFYVEGICGDSSSAHMMAHKRNYVTTRVHLKINESGKAVANVRMLPAVFPTIYKHPVDKSRLVGQSVKFCCKSRGSSKDHVYSWYHNGTLVDVRLYLRDPGSLEIHDLNLQHAGEYWCKVHSHTTSKTVATVSQTAILSVFEAETSACDEVPRPNFIKLPHGCATTEISDKRNGNSTYIDVGYCSTEVCPTYRQTVDVCGESGKVHCCGPSERREITVNCGEYSIPIYKIKRCGCQQCVRPVIKVQGRAYGNDKNDPLRFGYISIGSKRISTTSYDGSFSVTVPEGTKRLVLTFTDRFGKFVTTTKVLPFKQSGGVAYHEVKMARKSPAKVFHSREGSAVALSGIGNQDSVAQVVTGPNSFYTKEGRKYTGKVRASVTFIDPRNETSYQEAPTDLSFVSNNGEALPLQTYGMFEVDFRDDDSNELNIGKAKVVLDANAISSSTNINKLKLWSLNPENGMWEVEDNFQVARADDNERNGPKRRKREDQTFLVGNLEIRERRLYNLDAPAENRCWMKVRAYRSPQFVPEEQVEGVEITVINMEPEAGFRGNPQAWGRFDSELTKKNGACIRAFCHDSTPKAYKAIVGAKLDSSEELYAAASGFPLDPNVVGVDGEVLKKLEYKRSDHNEVTGKKTSFQTNLPKPKPEEKLSGPIYPEENYRDCKNAPVTDSHFRFFRTEDYLYEYNTIYMDEHNCITWTPHYLNWWPKPLEYRACYIKVHLESRFATVVRAKSFGGTHTETEGKLYGIRDDRSVTPDPTDVDSMRGSAACLEFKCSGMLYDMDIPDRTLVTVVPQGDCHLRRLNEKLTQYLTEHPPTVEAADASEFRMYAPSDPLGHNYGIYTVTDDDPLIAKKTALGRCYAGASDITSRIMDTRKGVAIYYRCSNSNRDQELP